MITQDNGSTEFKETNNFNIVNTNNNSSVVKNKEDIKHYRAEIESIQAEINKYEDLIRRNNNEIPSLESSINPEVRFSHEDKKLIKNLHLKTVILGKKGFYKKAEKASIIGDTVGDPLKDTSGPSLNILIKLSSIISVVFAGFFLKTGYLQKYFYV